MRGIAWLAWLFCLSATAAEPARDYVMLFQGRDSGGLTVEPQGDGEFRSHFSYRDNGRGPDLDETMQFDVEGNLLSYRGDGRSTYGAPILERFSRTGDEHSWQVGEQPQQSAHAEPQASYLPVEASPELFARLARRLAGAEQQRLPIMPSGSVQRQDIATLTFAETPLQARLVALHGLGLRPYFLWLDSQDELLADIEPGFNQLVRRDAQAQVKLLEQRQLEAERAVLKGFNQLAVDLPGLTVLRNVRVFDSQQASLGPASDVFIERGLFTAIYPAGAPVQGDAREIDGGGRVLLPGFVDMHVHISPWDGPLHLAAGVTSARDLGGENSDVLATMDAFASGRLLGPRIVPAGYIEGESPFASRSGFVIANLAEARDAIDWYAQHGYPQIKIYNSFPREILTDTVAYAHLRGLRVSGHVPAFLRAEDAVHAGFDELQHINQLFLNFLVKPGDDTRTLLRFDLVAAEGGKLDLRSKPVSDFVDLLKQHDVAVDATMATFENFRQAPGKLHPSFSMVADRLPALLARSLTVNSMDLGGAKFAPSERAYASMLAFIGQLHRAGITLVAGTDDLPGFTFQRELELYAEAGIAPNEVLRIATWNGARLARISDRAGSIAPGKSADAVLVDGDPTRNISDVRRAVLVLKAGHAYQPDQLYSALGVQPGTPSLPVTAER